jgi:hypothetical protein
LESTQLTHVSSQPFPPCSNQRMGWSAHRCLPADSTPPEMAAVIVRPQLREAERQYLDLYAGHSHAITGINPSCTGVSVRDPGVELHRESIDPRETRQPEGGQAPAEPSGATVARWERTRTSGALGS